jgi:hypothetical protein
VAVLFWLKRPRAGLARVRYWLWERANPDKPWLCPGTIAFCERNLNRSMLAIEFGSGRSTRWFAGLVGQLISIEHNAEWHAIVTRQLAEAGVANVDYRHVALDHPESLGEQPHYEPPPKYVAVADALAPQSIHLAIVDGHYRSTCVKHLISKIAPRGYLLVDDINMWPSLDAVPVPKSWTVADDSTNGVKRCIIWQAPE